MPKRLWSFCCSLKLAIVLASLATGIAIAGSLLMHVNPQVFGGLDALSLADWYTGTGSNAPLLSLWLYLTGLLLALLGLNTLCCFIDWLTKLRARWRKSGEYLIHLGFVLIIVAYFWGSLAGSRSQTTRLGVGDIRPVAGRPGFYLRLDAQQPVLNAEGRPVDMRSTISLLHADKLLQTAEIGTNTPLLDGDLTIVPRGYNQETVGYDVILTPLARTAVIAAGEKLDLANGYRLDIDRFLPSAITRGDDVIPVSDGSVNPAIFASLRHGDATIWTGWHFLRKTPPETLRQVGFSFVVRGPRSRSETLLTINTDPGLPLALAGAISLSVGVCFALFSFYDKRRRGDRPVVT